MAAPLITINQAAHSAGIAGKAREDLATGTNVDITLSGGPYAQVLWTVAGKPVNTKAGVQSAAFIITPSSQTTQVSSVDLPGTYRLQALVDQGSGLGATTNDVATITFYAGTALNSVSPGLPRRRPAFGERLEHNVNDAAFPAGNPRGYAEEWDRWFDLLEFVYDQSPIAWARVSNGGAAAIVGTGRHISAVNRTSAGVVVCTMDITLPNTNYGALVTLQNNGTNNRHTPNVDTQTTTQFTVHTYDGTPAAIDADFFVAIFGDKP